MLRLHLCQGRALLRAQRHFFKELGNPPSCSQRLTLCSRAPIQKRNSVRPCNPSASLAAQSQEDAPARCQTEGPLPLSSQPPQTPSSRLTWMTCRRCKQHFAAEHNHRTACRYHSEGWTGGELAKAVGFVRRSDAPEHQLGAVMGRTGLLRFWDCCGAEDETAPGCCTSFHIAFDDEVNERHGWR